MTDPTTNEQILIRKLTDIVLSELNNHDFGVKELISESGMSRTGLNRRLHKVLNKNINQFIREVRLQKALEILRNEEISASEVAYKVGFSSPAYFNTCFHKYFGYPPGKAKVHTLENGEKLLSGINLKQEKKESVIRKKAGTVAVIILLAALILIVGYNFYPQVFKSYTLDDLRSSDGKISVVVMPFQNMTDDKVWDAMQVNILASLSNYEDLSVRPKEDVEIFLDSRGITKNASIAPSVAGAISKKLGASVFVYGSINQTSSYIRLIAYLASSKTNMVIKSFQIDFPMEEDKIFVMMDSLSLSLKDFLVKSKIEHDASPDIRTYSTTSSPEAYRYFIEAHEALVRYDIKSSLDLYAMAVARDSNFFPAIIFLSYRYMDLNMYDDARKWCLKAYEKSERASKKERMMIYWYHATLFSTPIEELKYLNLYLEIDDQVPVAYWQKGNAYLKLFQYSKAIPEYVKALNIYKKWGVKPMMAENYTRLGVAYHQLGEYKKEKRLYRTANSDFPDNHNILKRYAILEISQGDTTNTNRKIEKFITALTGLAMSDAEIKTEVADIYSEAGLIKKAEEYYRKALSLEPGNPIRMNNLAYLLIDKDLNINEGMGLVETALTLEPGNYRLLHTRGLGFYKQGKYTEALANLNKSYDLKPLYDQEISLHLAEVKKAFTAQF